MSELNEQSGSETILVVDDEPSVLSIISAFLVRCGYDVLQANSGAEALEIWEKSVSPVQLLLTDVTMPQMTGTQLAESLLLSYPEMRVLYMSGYPPNPLSEVFLQKPFSRDTLVTLVRQTLDAPRKREPGRRLSGGEVRKANG